MELAAASISIPKGFRYTAQGRGVSRHPGKPRPHHPTYPNGVALFPYESVIFLRVMCTWKCTEMGTTITTVSNVTPLGYEFRPRQPYLDSSVSGFPFHVTGERIPQCLGARKDSRASMSLWWCDKIVVTGGIAFPPLEKVGHPSPTPDSTCPSWRDRITGHNRADGPGANSRRIG